MFSAGSCAPSHQRITAASPSRRRRGASAQSQPVLEQELETPDEERDARHHGVAVAGAESDHEEEHAEPRGDPERALVLTAVEEEQQRGDEPDREDDRVEARAELPGPQRLQATLHLRDEVTLREAGGLDARVDADDHRQRPARQPADLAEEAREQQQPEDAGNQQPKPVVAELRPEQDPAERLALHRLVVRERPAKRLEQVGDDHRPPVEDDVVAGRDADEQVLRELVERVVLVQEAEDEKGQERRAPHPEVARDVEAHGAVLRPFVHWTRLPNRMQNATKKCAIDWASMPRVALPCSWRAFSYSAAPAIPPSSPSSWRACRYA